MNRMLVHTAEHGTLTVCCLCKHRYPRHLLEVWVSGNWHPICRPCLKDIGLAVFGAFTSGPSVLRSECEGQQVLV